MRTGTAMFFNSPCPSSSSFASSLPCRGRTPVVVHPLREAYAVRFGDRLDARCDIYAVSVRAAVGLLDDFAEMQADAKAHATALRDRVGSQYRRKSLLHAGFTQRHVPHVTCLPKAALSIARGSSPRPRAPSDPARAPSHRNGLSRCFVALADPAQCSSCHAAGRLIEELRANLPARSVLRNVSPERGEVRLSRSEPGDWVEVLGDAIGVLSNRVVREA